MTVWSDERVAKLRELWLQALSAREIANELGNGLSRNAVIGKVHRLGLPGRMACVRPKAPAAPIAKRDAHIWERHENDWYVEPEWCSRRLFEAEAFGGYVWDPACGGGNIIKSALACGIEANGSDIADRGFGGVQDFLDPQFEFVGVTNIVSNPPFELADQFVARALDIARHTVAMLLPAVWHCGDKRSRWLAITPLRKVLILTPRPSMPPGSVLAAGIKAGGGTKDFAWFIWHRGYRGPIETGWLRRDA